MNKIAADYITENNGKFVVHAASGKPMGTYGSREEANKRLKQIEYFKNAGGAVDMEPVEMDRLRGLLDKFFGEPAHALDGAKIGAGIIFQTPTGRVLLLRRAADEKNYGGHWGLPGGKAEDGETPEQAARRETAEETGISIPDTMPLKPVNKVDTPNGFEFHTFLCAYPEEFAPVLANGEHDDHQWAALDNLPTPIHPGVTETLDKLESRKPGAADAIALDKDSVRTIDDVGRMHVASAHISKATVNPYYGREIPNWQELGLDPERVYQMFRDPAELEKAAQSFEGIQVLIRHIPVSADDHRPDEIVGTTGTNAEFNHPYLDNELVIWAKPGIDAIESDAQRELSCGYGYTPVMEPGTFEGAHYDGRMTDIKGNHVALVSKGRAGPDVVVGDEALKPPQENIMTKPLSRTAARVHAALSAHLMPKIALDQQLKLSTALGTALLQLGATEAITRAALKKPNFRTAIVKMAKDAAEPLMTAEAKKAGFGPDDVVMRVLDMVDGQAADEPEEVLADPAKSADWRQGVMDALMKGGMDEKAAGAICDMFPGTAEAEAEDEEETAEEKAAKEKAEKDKTEKDKKAMDEAIKSGIDAAVAAERQRSKDAAEARQFVEPWVGKVSLAHDSAEDIYRTTLGMLGVKHEAVKEGSALKILVEAQPKPHERSHSRATFATDSAPEGKAFTDMFPGAERIGHAA